MIDSDARDPGPPDDAAFEALVERIRRTIATIDEQRRDAAAQVGAAVVGRAETAHAVGAQRAHLDAARAEIARSLQAADRAVEQREAAPPEPDVAREDSAPYRATADALRSAHDVVLAALAQLEALDVAALDTVERARAVLTRSRASLDAAMREQVRLLAQLERARRAHTIARLRAQRRGGQD